MNMMSFQEKRKKEEAFFKEHPEWLHIVMEAVNQWGREERSLNHAIGEALLAAHAMGGQGVLPATPAQPKPKQEPEEHQHGRVLRRRSR